MRENNSADTKVGEEGGARHAPASGTEIFLQSILKTTVKQVVPLQPMEDPMLNQLDVLKGGCELVGSPC